MSNLLWPDVGGNAVASVTPSFRMLTMLCGRIFSAFLIQMSENDVEMNQY